MRRLGFVRKGIERHKVRQTSCCEVIDEAFAADYLVHDPASPMEVKGPEGFKQWAGAMLEPYFSDSHTSADMIAEEDKVAADWTWSGTHTQLSLPLTARKWLTTPRHCPDWEVHRAACTSASAALSLRTPFGPA